MVMLTNLFWLGHRQSLAEQADMDEIEEALGKTTTTVKTSWVSPCRAPLLGRPGSSATR
jgi:hypothetical protein